jgi:uncharacterized membrane protein
VLAAFAGRAAYEDDGQGSARAWLKWQSRVTTGAAAGAVGWVRRLAAHPVIGQALAAGELSESWARQVCAWTSRLPLRQQDDADEILTAAARGGVDLAGLAGLAQEMYERAHRDSDDGGVPDGFGDRALWLDTTLGGAGRLTGHLDWAALDRLTEVFLTARAGTAASAARAGTPASGGRAWPAAGPLSPDTRQRLRRALLALAADALSGPGGLAAQLRAGPDGPLASVSLPLDVGPATETIPAHLRRLVMTRHPHCAFPGCAQPASVCEIHHIIPRSRGGPTSLGNLLTLCAFHHKILIHRWGWTVRLNPDGTTTATSPSGRTLHSHSPPGQAA